ncbi:uncharacterized protein LOC105843724 [Hydra vulgaris]|uniref:uncharacterized protein LOC105843724 n=1 Tax=Hydra vulgaris TaxID=6087 RepID=UPI0032EA59DE
MAVTLVEIKKMIKDLFTKYKVETEAALKQQENNFINIVSANTKILNEILDKVEKNILENAKKISTLATEVEEIKFSLNFHEELIENKIKTALDIFIKNKPTHNEIQNNNIELKKINSKLREIEDRSRRSNLRVKGVKEDDNESWLESEIKVKKIFDEYLGIKDVKIERAHRAGKEDIKKHRTIVVKLLDFKDKEAILRNSSKLKGKNIFINEDFCAETNRIRKDLREKMKIERQSGKFAYISYDKLIVREWNAKKK